MPRFTSLPRPVLLTLAVILAAAMIAYSALWMYYIRWEQKIYFGIEREQSPQAGALVIAKVVPGGPAEQAGLQAGDRILSINDRRLTTLYPFFEVLRHGRAENAVQLLVERGGPPGPHTFQVSLQPRAVQPKKLSLVEFLSSQLIGSFPVWFLVVSLPVLFMRLEDRNAWLMTLLFAGVIAGGPLLFLEPLIEPHLVRFAVAYKILFAGTWSFIFNYFFAVFPAPSFLDRRFPWLKTLLLAAALLVSVPLAVWATFTSADQPLLHLAIACGPKIRLGLVVADFFAPLMLGIVSLVGNGFFASSPEVQRKIRVIVWGTVAGLMPGLLVYSVPEYLGKGTQFLPIWFWGLFSLTSFWLFPLSFAYAVVKHRVMEIPLLLKRSARYLLVQRGFVIIHVLLSTALTLILILALTRSFKPDSRFALPAVLMAAMVFGSALALSGIRIHRTVTQRIDRAFFRGAYNARQILEGVAEKIRGATDPQQLASLLAGEIHEALHPLFVTVYLEGEDGSFRPMSGQGPPLTANLPLIKDLARRAAPMELSASTTEGGFAALALFWALPPDCLLPILGVGGRMAGVVSLGPRLSDEPYSGEDKRLLASVASQAGFAIESMRLAAQMAQRMEAEQRAAHEMEIAKQVQARLLPQEFPKLKTLDYAGGCIQARQVGGDYFDFLNLGPGRLGFVLADIAGKGISGALLMANLQANLRSQAAVAAADLSRFLTSVNQLFFANTSDESYATLFFADYDEATRRLRYVNCGHNPPLLFRAKGELLPLKATTTVLGLFVRWECPIGEIALASGDVLLIYTDGITEAMNHSAEEFGEERLVAALREARGLSAQATLESIFNTVQRFAGGEQSDDLTLVVVRALSA